MVVRYLKTIAEKSRVVGTRGDYTAEVLTKLGIRNVEPIGCPSLYMNGTSLHPLLLQKRPFADIRKVALVYSNYQFSGASLISEALALAASHNYYFVEQTSGLIPTLLYYPHKLTAEDFLTDGLRYGGLTSLRALYHANKLRYFTNVGNWKEFLSRMDFAFGGRIHGLTPALQSGVPAHFIAHDSRMREICEFFRLPFSAEHDFMTTGFDVQKIYDRTDYSEAAKLYPARYRGFLEFLAANRIRPNCDENLRIAEQVDFSPSPGVEVEGDPATDGDINLPYARVLFEMGKAIGEQGSTKGYEKLVQTCARLWGEELAERKGIDRPKALRQASAKPSGS